MKKGGEVAVLWGRGYILAGQRGNCKQNAP